MNILSEREQRALSRVWSLLGCSDIALKRFSVALTVLFCYDVTLERRVLLMLRASSNKSKLDF